MSYKLQVTSYKLRVSKLLLVVIFCITGFFAGAQTKWSYEYDNAGNRLSRTIDMTSPPPTSPPPPQDSIETIIEDLENPIAAIQDTENGGEKSQEIYTDTLSETLITIYPNPTMGLLTVKFSDLSQHAVSSLTLFDMHGRVITQQQSLSEENKLDISAQPTGTYIMQIAVGSEITSWKIIKN